jgi:hypothetical protein
VDSFPHTESDLKSEREREREREKRENGESRVRGRKQKGGLSNGGVREAREGRRRDVREGVQGEREGDGEDRGPQEDSPPRGRRGRPSHHSPRGLHSPHALLRSPRRQVYSLLSIDLFPSLFGFDSSSSLIL